jgi:hypothetical protein
MVFLIFLLSILPITDGVPFSHNVDFEHPESGERVKLQSTGQLTNAVDLDRIDIVYDLLIFQRRNIW